ncbi:hypothetical protein ACTFQF_00805 [Aliivibrio fischeri]|uniref:Uncharacterized protein n=1 Tax=Aliivibrio fischeri (strain MJ11) TaxID=388396 RepID=B5EW85_ALIFM|nr:hypothetical protein [Aliivibrio fischeri]ACH64745.1 hypothetical protein VFMJ11_B0142 [Aliivibrio fischeri MJ11]MUK37591.1 hypothetical protein [Aliivibrio fischeri]
MSNFRHNNNAPLNFDQALMKSCNSESALLDDFDLDRDELDLANESIHHDLQHIMEDGDIWNQVSDIDKILNIREA